MARRTRLGEFPGGVLEINAYDDDPVDGYPGVYLEIYHAADDTEEGTEMRYRATAIGYLRTDVSGAAQFRDESRIRELAARLGYDFADMIVYDPKFGRPPLARLKAQATRLDAAAVIVPGPEHFEGGHIPASLVGQVDVITVTPEEVCARRAMSPDLPRQGVQGQGGAAS
ncbi:hypothetical protein [Nocardia otitidiscaviarum]|uniref:hypothetical protein n=1 Tax=Nocardia otitidiscaviarum TaxID=1823 RepID=UPI001893A2C8|nr:hypothetical protein [Nocardia otitidiscaviarum]MBF6179698.1 hypothetical protein [Nocardia otitidiscaviarum]